MKRIEERAVDELGRIVLPSTIRQDLGVEVKDVMDIYIDDDMVILKKSQSVPHCAVCGTADDLQELPNMPKTYVCSRCKKAVNELK